MKIALSLCSDDPINSIFVNNICKQIQLSMLSREYEKNATMYSLSRENADGIKVCHLKCAIRKVDQTRYEIVTCWIYFQKTEQGSQTLTVLARELLYIDRVLWVKALKNGLSKICGKQPLKKLKHFLNTLTLYTPLKRSICLSAIDLSNESLPLTQRRQFAQNQMKRSFFLYWLKLAN